MPKRLFWTHILVCIPFLTLILSSISFLLFHNKRIWTIKENLKVHIIFFVSFLLFDFFGPFFYILIAIGDKKGQMGLSVFILYALLTLAFVSVFYFLTFLKSKHACRYCKSVLKEGATVCAACGSDQAQEFVCPHCQQSLQVYDKNEGDIVRCPYCQGGFTVP